MNLTFNEICHDVKLKHQDILINNKDNTLLYEKIYNIKLMKNNEDEYYNLISKIKLNYNIFFNCYNYDDNFIYDIYEDNYFTNEEINEIFHSIDESIYTDDLLSFLNEYVYFLISKIDKKYQSKQLILECIETDGVSNFNEIREDLINIDIINCFIYNYPHLLNQIPFKYLNERTLFEYYSNMNNIVNIKYLEELNNFPEKDEIINELIKNNPNTVMYLNGDNQNFDRWKKWIDGNISNYNEYSLNKLFIKNKKERYKTINYLIEKLGKYSIFYLNVEYFIRYVDTLLEYPLIDESKINFNSIFSYNIKIFYKLVLENNPNNIKYINKNWIDKSDLEYYYNNDLVNKHNVNFYISLLNHFTCL